MPPPDKSSNKKLKLAEPVIYPGLGKGTDDGPSKSSEPHTDPDPHDPEYRAKCRLLSLLRDIRADLQMIRCSLIELSARDLTLDHNRCYPETHVIHNKTIERCSSSIINKLKSIHDIFSDYPCISSHSSDTVQIIENRWEQVHDLLTDHKEDAWNKSDDLEKCIKYLEENIYYCSFLTVPSRVAAHLQTLRSGYALDFYEEFKDEFSSKEQAKDLLKYLARHPAFIDDIIDTSQGSIFKVDPKSERWKSYLRVFAAFVLGIGAIIGSLWLLREQIDQGYITAILKMYLVFVCGALFHIFIDAMKVTRSSTGLNFRSVEDWFLWANIKELSIIAGIFLLDFTFIGLIFIFNTSGNIDALTLAAAGYSFDSIGEVISGRFETILSAKGETLKEKVSGMK